MTLQLSGLHHITAVTGDAPRNVAFYTQVLGMRLVKKTVNQDDVSAYHLFYGDSLGHAGTELTFFDWPDAGANRDGTGTIAAIALRAPSAASLARWASASTTHSVPHAAIEERAGRATLDLRRSRGPAPRIGRPRAGEEPPPAASPGPAARSPPSTRSAASTPSAQRRPTSRPTARALTEALGFRVAGQYELAAESGDATHIVHVYQTGPGGLGAEVHVVERPTSRAGASASAASTTSPSAPRTTRSSSPGASASRGRPGADPSDRPLLLPLGLLPRAGRRPLRDRHRRPRLRHRRRPPRTSASASRCRPSSSRTAPRSRPTCAPSPRPPHNTQRAPPHAREDTLAAEEGTRAEASSQAATDLLEDRCCLRPQQHQRGEHRHGNQRQNHRILHQRPGPPMTITAPPSCPYSSPKADFAAVVGASGGGVPHWGLLRGAATQARLQPPAPRPAAISE